MKKRQLPPDPEKQAREQAALLRAWKAFHSEQLEQALASAHGAVIAELMGVLDRLEIDSAAALLAAMQRADWHSVDYTTRLTVLHQVNQAVTRLREKHGMAPFDDGPPGTPDNAFRKVKALLFPEKVPRVGRDVTATKTTDT
jgi:hypothetical protein